MLWIVFTAVLVLWMAGVMADVGGSLIHLLLVVAALLAASGMLSSRRTVN